MYRDLALFAAVGLALQEPDFIKRLPPEQHTAVAEVLAAIRDGRSPKPGVLFFGLRLMPELFRAAGIYAKTPELSRYFAWRQWYATRVFRLVSAPENLARCTLPC